MSDLGLLSYQYQELAELAQQLKNWAIQVKYAHHQWPLPESDLVQTDLATATTELGRVTRFLSEVISLADEKAWPEQWLTNPPLPTALVERLRKAHEYELPLYTNQLARLSKRLNEDVEALTDKDMALLDGIVLAADADVNTVFRRLMRWR